MNCTFINHGDPDAAGKCRRRCIRCRFTTKRRYSASTSIERNCPAFPFWWELGHWLAVFLAAAGITKGRWNAVRLSLGLGPCRCGEHQEQYNGLGARLARWLASIRKFNSP